MRCEEPDIVRSYYESIDAEAYETAFALFDDDVVYERPGQDDISEDDTVSVRGLFGGLQDGTRVAFGFADFFVFTDAGTIGRRYTDTDRDTV